MMSSQILHCLMILWVVLTFSTMDPFLQLPTNVRLTILTYLMPKSCQPGFHARYPIQSPLFDVQNMLYFGLWCTYFEDSHSGLGYVDRRCIQGVCPLVYSNYWFHFFTHEFDRLLQLISTTNDQFVLAFLLPKVQFYHMFLRQLQKNPKLSRVKKYKQLTEQFQRSLDLYRDGTKYCCHNGYHLVYVTTDRIIYTSACTEYSRYLPRTYNKFSSELIRPQDSELQLLPIFAWKTKLKWIFVRTGDILVKYLVFVPVLWILASYSDFFVAIFFMILCLLVIRCYS